MKRFGCVCGNTLFFENSTCVNCKRDVGWCPACKQISALEPVKAGGFTCLNPKCKTHVLKCDNYFTYNVCNRCVVPAKPPAATTATTPLTTAAPAAAAATAPAAPAAPPMCDYCRFNRTIPNLSVPTNKQRWARIEAAKRRALYDFDRLGLRYGSETDGVTPPLRFDFKADADDPAARYRDVARTGDDAGGGEQVFTGHDSGLITINLKEADSVQREKARVEFREAHRTLVGHFRHEMGHYVWEVSVKGEKRKAFDALFGDPDAVPYGDALTAYYQNGPKPDWQKSYVSAYATMHPWEDWAETFANYLDLMATLETAQEGKLLPPVDPKKFDDSASAYVKLGLTLNELNRGIGLVDFLPEVIVEPVRKKMAFVHSLTRYG